MLLIVCDVALTLLRLNFYIYIFTIFSEIPTFVPPSVSVGTQKFK
jgi:hypothetical protein